MLKYVNEILDLKKNFCIIFGLKFYVYFCMICLLFYVNLFMVNIGRFWGIILMILKLL